MCVVRHPASQITSKDVFLTLCAALSLTLNVDNNASLLDTIVVSAISSTLVSTIDMSVDTFAHLILPYC